MDAIVLYKFLYILQPETFEVTDNHLTDTIFFAVAYAGNKDQKSRSQNMGDLSQMICVST
jgi:hypothetical protein